LQVVSPTKFDALPGKGIVAEVDGKIVMVGNAKLLEDDDVDIASMKDTFERLSAGGKTPMYVAVADKPAGVIAVADTIKEGSVEAIAEFRHLGIEPVMITGDNRRTSRRPSRSGRITQVLAEVLPQDKANGQEAQAEGKRS
jgi:Cu+-exporting ATPase